MFRKFPISNLFLSLLVLAGIDHQDSFAGELLADQELVGNSKIILAANDSAKDGQVSDVKKDTADKTIELREIEVKQKKTRVLTPLPGLILDRGTTTTHVQSATGKQIAESKAINVTEFMNGEIASVSVNDYAGNPFQQDLNFRGFTASPAIGTPQGISVYLDGVRVNESFGDVVNWDLIPMNALASLDLVPGSNPMFGLNTLGGALALRTKTGFTDMHARGQFLGGDWGRKQIQLSNGMNNGTLGLFTAYNHFKEDGWRDNSPSNLRQLYNDLTLRAGFGELNLSALNVDTHLTGNGLVPFENAATDREQVFTSPDNSTNELGHYNLNARFDVSDKVTASALTYVRKVRQKAFGGDINEAYNATVSALGGPYTEIPNPDGCVSTFSQSHCPDASKLNGTINTSSLFQTSEGGALQFTFDLDTHQIAAGLTYDRNRIRFRQGQQLAEVDANHAVHYGTDPFYGNGPFDWNFIGAQGEIIRNDLKGSSRTKSVFFTDTWSPIDTLHVTYGARFNWTHVQNTLRSDKGNELYNFNNNTFKPSYQRCSVPGKDGRFVCSEGDYDYRSFNPALGVTWEFKEEQAVYGNVSRGARVPTVIELGCAVDHTADNSPTSTNFQYGCSIPTSLTSDPYLKQVRSTAYEAGWRGSKEGIDWNIGLFRTELKDDILFVPLGRKNRGVFDNFGETLRQGIEMGMKGELGKSQFGLNYTYMRATFESPVRIINASNSSNTAATTLQNYVNIQPGDELPGMPRHIFQANWNHRFTDRFDATLSMVTHSSSYVRGNENNDHYPREATNVIAGGKNRDPYDYIGKGSVSGYTVFNLRANYKMDHGITLFAKIDNLFDKEYATAGDLGMNPFNRNGAFISDQNDWNSTTFIGPGAPRVAWFGLGIDLDWKKLNTKKE